MNALAVLGMALGILCVTPLSVSAASVNTEEALIVAAAAGGNVKLTKSLELTQTITVPSGKSVVLDLNGKTLDRNVATTQENGSVILVEKGAVLTVTDSTSSPGVITGGSALCGGGICNYGDVTLENGFITGNKALDDNKGLGGGVYNGSGATLTVKGGTITGNRARLGGGVYNEAGALLTIQQGSYRKKVGSIVSTVITNANVSANKAAVTGDGIYNAGALKMQDSPKIRDNGVDLYLAEGTAISFTGALKTDAAISVLSAGNDPVITEGFERSGASDPNVIFSSASYDAVMMMTMEGEVRFRTSAQTTVLTYSGDKLASAADYSRPTLAWETASSNAKAGKKVVMILGSDWNEDEVLVIEKGNLTLDLNGHYIKRTRNYEQIRNGEVFRVKEGATFTVKDSNPYRKSYDGLKGGVITGGASTNGAGGVHLEKGSTFNMLGGTIYECVTSEDGGAINAADKNITINMKDCRIYFCQTVDSFDSCFGGGIFLKSTVKLTLENVSIEDCYSENSGGGLYASFSEGTSVVLKNVLFSGNKAYDNGGAIYLLRGTGVDFRADGCTFVGNLARKEGGAFVLSGSTKNDQPVILNDCTFKSNYAGTNGSAICAECDGLVLTSATATDNVVGSNLACGAVYVRKNVILSIGGLTVIRDNETGSSIHKDLVLEREFSDYAKVYCMGLEANSYVAFSLEHDTKEINKTYAPLRNVSEYQLQYFHAAGGTLTFEKETETEAPIAFGSVFGNGSVTVLFITAAAFALILAGALAVKTKRKQEKKGGSDNENQA